MTRKPTRPSMSRGPIPTPAPMNDRDGAVGVSWPKTGEAHSMAEYGGEDPGHQDGHSALPSGKCVTQTHLLSMPA